MENSKIFHGDCLDIISSGKIKAESVNFIFTSPPYAEQRKKQYGGIHINDYVDWFLVRSEAFKNILKSDGSFVLNIKENVVKGQRHIYVIQLILALKKQGWLWVDEYCWHKKTSVPGKWPNRFRDSWERLLHFTINTKFKMRQDSVKVPIGDWSKSRLKKLSKNDKIRLESKTNSGFGKKLDNWVDRKEVYPTNVLYLANETAYRGHPATFPLSLPTWFIKLFTDENDIVLDPFAGSGTTLLAAKNLNRFGMGVDISLQYCNLMKERLES